MLATTRVMVPCQISHTRRYFDFNQIETIVEPRKLITKLLEPKPNSDDAVNNAKNRSQNVALIYHIRKISLLLKQKGWTEKNTIFLSCFNSREFKFVRIIVCIQVGHFQAQIIAINSIAIVLNMQAIDVEIHLFYC